MSVGEGFEPWEGTNPQRCASSDLLHPGLNLIGLVVNWFQISSVRDWMGVLGGSDATESVSSIPPQNTIVDCGYNGDLAQGTGCDVTIESGGGWMVRAKSSQTSNINVGVDCSVTTLQPGASLVSFGCVTASTSAFSLLQIYGGASGIESIESLGENDKWVFAALDEEGNIVGKDFSLSPFASYILHASYPGGEKAMLTDNNTRSRHRCRAVSI